MEDIDWSHESDLTDVNELYGEFLSNFMQVYDWTFPVKIYRNTEAERRKITKQAARWYNTEIKKAINKRNRLARRCRTSKAISYPMCYEAYRTQRNHVVSLIRKIKKEYLSTKIGKCLTNRGGWKEVNKILGKCSKDMRIDELMVNQTLICDDYDMATSLNNYFRDEPNNLVRELYNETPGDIDSMAISLSDKSQEGSKERNQTPNPKINAKMGTVSININQDSLFLHPVSYCELRQVVMELKIDKSPGMDGVLPLTVKYAFDGIATPLLELMNLIFTTGVFPTELKQVRLLPIHKKGDLTSLANYRPIALISVFSKIIEKLIYNRIVSFLDKHDIISQEQFGFRKRRSTEQALLSYWDWVLSTLEKGQKIVTVFMDLKKAFDCINHDILMNKLNEYGLRGIVKNLIHSYLKDRRNVVMVNGVDSAAIKTNRGVPQGSLLGPLLFLIYVNDLMEHAEDLTITMFADDLTCAFKGDSVIDTVIRANNDLYGLTQWLAANELIINYNKSKYMIYGVEETRKVGAHNANTVKLDGHSLELVSSYKFLGVWIDSNCKWKTHCDYVTRELAMGIGRIRKISTLIDNSKVLFQLYYTFIYSRLLYMISLWGGTNVGIGKTMLLLQKRCIRVALGLGYFEPVTHLFHINGILTFEEIYRYRLGVIMYAIIKGIYAVRSLTILFSRISDTHAHKTRRCNNLFQRGCFTQRGTSALRFRGPEVWNQIPLNIRNSSTLHLFKKKYKHLLLEASSL